MSGRAPGRTPQATPLLRVLVGFALLGAGIVNLGSVRGTFPAPAGILALMLGAVETGGSLLVLAGTRPRAVGITLLGRAAIGTLVLGSVVQAALAVSGGATLGAPVVATTALQLASAGAIGVLTRSAPSPAGPAARGAGTTVAALFVGAIVVASVTTFGLTGTQAAENAVPHGEHGLPSLPGLHQHHP
ncbi:hypothetical protein IF650_11220 [Cellulosimicrobium terreum]|nr:hypothetical protein [Cellulosimicrobium terreum]